MKEVVILSGKGGTGKTVVAASLISMQESTVAVDCDLDAPNLHLLLDREERSRRPLTSMKALVSENDCNGCGTCARMCRFHAISLQGKGRGWRALVDPDRCEGCDLCRLICPKQAIEMGEHESGEQMVSKTSNGWLVHGVLEPPAENVGRFASRLKDVARDRAREDGSPLLFVDGPPGIGCPTIASLSGADFCLLVTEPTASGLYDLERAAFLARQMHVPAAVLINRWDLNRSMAGRIESRVAEWGLPLLGKLAFDERVPQSIIRAAPMTKLFPQSDFSEGLADAWDGIRARLGL
jgi:MinD superfamily P-loop ATPase